MKTLKISKLFIAIFASAFLLTSCLNDDFTDIKDSTTNYVDFDFKTTKEISVNIEALTNDNNPIPGVNVTIYSKNPLNENGALIENFENYQIFSGITLNNGKLETNISTATAVDSIYVLSNYIGLESYKVANINTTNELSIVFGGASTQNTNNQVGARRVKSEGIWWVSDFWKVNDFYAYSTWNNSGVPNNLVSPDDVISSDFLADINASLPESKKLPNSHPEYFNSEDDGSLVLIEDAEVWVTFVHEGAAWLNSLAYYTYPSDKVPANKSEIKYPTIVFPNVSFSGFGGGLKSGNKVQLLYFDETKNQYTNLFPAGTTVAWVLRANGWSSSSKTVGSGSHTVYSNAAFNPESNDNEKKHNILLKDDKRKLILIGFEDMRRDYGSDNDFNDAVFYATVSPFTAVKNSIYQTIDTPTDTDGDGVSDTRDEYPTDPKRAFNNYYPSKNATATLAYEDLWPSKGDYDFNDLVVDYNFNQITNAENKVVDIDAKLTVRAIGASYHNAFAIQLNVAATNIASVTGQSISTDIFTLNSNGTESNQEKAVIVAFDDAYKVFPTNPAGGYVNTLKSAQQLTANTIDLKICFVNPVSTSDLGTAPFNPFIVVNKVRGKEVHLSGYAPTSLANTSLFGQGQDDSNVSIAKYYTSDMFLPWALNIPVQFDYPAEKEEITNAYLKFNDWATSKGSVDKDWYSNISGYRDNTKIY